ncbi:REEP5, partial [Symbiodinium microadriaticum]
DVIAYGYPFYQSIKCIESKEKDDDKQWLVYWVVFGILGCLETFIHIITYWIPFYYPLKLTFLIWCMHPSYCGATVIYNKVLKDLVDTHMDKIDDIINNPSALLKTDDTKKD